MPFDDKSPFVTSGIRVGVPAITTRGLKEREMETVVGLIDKVLMDIDNENTLNEVKGDVRKLMNEFPLYAQLGFE